MKTSSRLVSSAVIASAVLSAMLIASSAYAQTYVYEFRTHLSNMNEVPPVTDATMTGSAWFGVRSGNAAIDYTLHATGTEIVNAAHLHCASSGTSGLISAPLSVAGYGTSSATTTSSTIHATGTIWNSDITSNCSGITSISTLVNEMNGGDIYANVHSTQHPAGLSRGQLSLSATATPTTTPPYTPPTTPTSTPTTTPPTPNQPTADEISDMIREILDEIRLLQHRLIQLLVQVRLNY